MKQFDVFAILHQLPKGRTPVPKEKYDIFISYRRQGGEDEAWKLKFSLEKMGYRVFMDREALRSGDFNEQLYRRIEECRDFLLVCSAHALDRCKNEDDWVRKEVTHAIEKKKNIIPVWLSGFDSTQMEALPPELESLRRLQAVTPQNATYDESIRKLERYLQAKPVQRYMNDTLKWFGVFAAAAVVIVLLAAGFFSLLGHRSDFPRTQKEEKQVEAIQAAACLQLSTLNVNLGNFNQAVEACLNYVGGYNNDQDAVRLECLNRKECIEKQTIPAWTRTPETEDYDGVSHLENLSSIVRRSGEYTQYISYMEQVVFESRLKNDRKKTVLEYLSKIAQQDAELASSETFLLFLPVTQPETTLKTLLDGAKEWDCLPAFGKSWIKGTEREPELERSVEISRNSRYQAMLSCQSTSGIDWRDFDVQLEK